MKITRNKKKVQKPLFSNFQTYITKKNINISSNFTLESLYQILLKNPQLINEKDSRQETLLSYAIKKNKIEIFNLLLTSSILDLNYKNKDGNSYLHLSILFEREKMVKSLIKKGININSQNNEGNTPLHFAYDVDNKNIINELILNNPNFYIKNNKGFFPEENKKRRNVKKNSKVNSFSKYKSNIFKNNIIENNKEINAINNNIKNNTVNNDIIYDTNKKNNLKFNNNFSNENVKSKQIILNMKKKIENFSDETKSNTQRNSIKSSKNKLNEDDITYNLTSSIEKQRTINFDKINYNLNNNNSNNNSKNNSNNYYVINEDDDTIKINPFQEIKKPSMKKYKTSVLFYTKHNSLKKYNNNLHLNNNISNNILTNKIYSDKNIIRKKKITNINTTINNMNNNISIYKTNDINNNNNIISEYSEINLPYKRNKYNTLTYKNETKIKFSLPDIRNIFENYTKNNKKEEKNDLLIIPNNINNTYEESNPLYEFLSKINMEKYYKNLSLNGFDDIKLIIEQTKNNTLGITDENLKESGILIPGDRIKIIIKIQDLANNFSFEIPNEVFYCCDKLKKKKKDKNIIKLNNWLKSISLENLLNNFISNGYFSLELLLIQVISKEPLNLNKLKNDLGIEKIGFRQRIMNKLKDDSRKFINKLKSNILIVDENKSNQICNDCYLF